MKNNELLVSFQQAVKALTDIQYYCYQQENCDICKIQKCCYYLKYFSRAPALWDVEKILK